MGTHCRCGHSKRAGYLYRHPSFPTHWMHMKAGNVRQWACTHEETFQSQQKDIPLLDNCTYKVKFLDGRVAKYTSYMIALSMYVQFKPSSVQHLLLEAGVGYKSNTMVVPYVDRFTTFNRRQY